ncbi:MAG TPA: OpgC domain-containing protein, partial [Alphaproteobacteria bacterium]|nr:OpgC domain-containing protein [Alphaproteobacteria bacterium]
YILFLLAFPAVLAALSRNALLALIPSAALYLGVQLFGWNLTTFPRDEGWFFDPLAWQFLFVIGAALGTGSGARFTRWLFSPWLVVSAAALALPIAAYQEASMLHTLWPSIPAPSALALPMEKVTLPPLRLVSFFALAITTYHLLPRGAAFGRMPFVNSVACCGRHSLHVFCLGILLAVFGYVALEQRGLTPGSEFVVAAGGSAVLIAFARILDWLRVATDRVLPRLRPAPLARKIR